MGKQGLTRILGRALAAVVMLRTVWRALRRPRAVPARATARSTDGGGRRYEDPSEREVPESRRYELIVAALFSLAAAGAIGFIVLLALVQYNTRWLGADMGLTALCIAAAFIVAGKLVVPQEIHVEERDRLLKPEAVEEVVEIVEAGGEGISRRGLLIATGGLAGTALLGAAAAPVASLGPPAHLLHQDPWASGIRLVDESGAVYAASDIHFGALYTALPEGGNPESLGAGLLVVRLPPHWINLPKSRAGWAPDGIMAYSKICPHAGCAISTYRYPVDAQTTNDPPAFTCPCHYSTFTPGDGGVLVFGPAGRELPQLPLMIDSEGNLRCAGQFDEDIGPSWWGIKRPGPSTRGGLDHS